MVGLSGHAGWMGGGAQLDHVRRGVASFHGSSPGTLRLPDARPRQLASLDLSGRQQSRILTRRKCESHGGHGVRDAGGDRGSNAGFNKCDPCLRFGRRVRHDLLWPTVALARPPC